MNQFQKMLNLLNIISPLFVGVCGFLKGRGNTFYIVAIVLEIVFIVGLINTGSALSVLAGIIARMVGFYGVESEKTDRDNDREYDRAQELIDAGREICLKCIHLNEFSLQTLISPTACAKGHEHEVKNGTCLYFDGGRTGIPESKEDYMIRRTEEVLEHHRKQLKDDAEEWARKYLD